jgi:methylphosphotriester-DNA--protein-cysteine methyltransferase
MACLLSGERVTTIAFDPGYSSPAAFTTMFQRIIGSAPDRYRRMSART